MTPTSSVSERGILNPRAAEASFRITRHAPSEDLAFFIERYWIICWDLRDRLPHRQETLPQPCVNMVIEAGKSAVHGVGTRKFGVLLEGRGLVVGTKWKPGAFYSFLGRPVSEITDRSLPLGEVFGDGAAGLEEAVLAAEDDAAQIALVEALLRSRLPARDENVATVVEIVRIALADREMTKAEDLAARTGLSLRTLQRLFQRYVGVSPKWVIRRFRLHEAADRVAEGNVVDWAALALELGYCDQAHFSRDFKAQVGHTPSAYAAICAR